MKKLFILFFVLFSVINGYSQSGAKVNVPISMPFDSAYIIPDVVSDSFDIKTSKINISV